MKSKAEELIDDLADVFNLAGAGWVEKNAAIRKELIIDFIEDEGTLLVSHVPTTGIVGGIDRSSTFKAPREWIKCSERLSELRQLVLTYSYDKKMDWGQMTHQHWWEVCRDGMEHVEVTHWMEIPEAPKEEE